MPYGDPSVLETLVSQSALSILVSFRTTWTEAMTTRLRDIVQTFAGCVQAVQLDITAHPYLMEHFRIQVIPTWLLFRRGVPVE
jgi:thioredoxin-like negative regulator of GroEL